MNHSFSSCCCFSFYEALADNNHESQKGCKTQADGDEESVKNGNMVEGRLRLLTIISRRYHNYLSSNGTEVNMEYCCFYLI